MKIGQTQYVSLEREIIRVMLQLETLSQTLQTMNFGQRSASLQTILERTSTELQTFLLQNVPTSVQTDLSRWTSTKDE